MVFFMARTVIFLNGSLPSPECIRKLISPGDYLIAADGGARHALELGLAPSMVIGDLDSLSDEDRRTLVTSGTDMRVFPRDKNETDFELALHQAVGTGSREILVVAALGGRLDMTLANLALLSDPVLQELDVRVDDGNEQILFTRKHCEIRGIEGDIVSLVPWNGDVTAVVSDGLRWPLRRETLQVHGSRGLSNEMTASLAHVSVETGLLFVIHRRTHNV
jgi:thiamine pyrophosphokinase